ncbi:unnamed protein product [Symbiodinium natans]|uniref:Pentatricopeptide repeat-containing protein, chloroplastic n=1 Tax=Symbiodinium natans TaxID=878477 RepID=A0A812I9V6_9DINO|nr:unnamed protein product [Symbiodinium natans]
MEQQLEYEELDSGPARRICIAAYQFDRCLCAAVFCFVCIYHLATFSQNLLAKFRLQPPRHEYQFDCVHNGFCGITDIDWESDVVPIFTLIWKNRSETSVYAATAWPSPGKDECLVLCAKNKSCTGYSWRGWCSLAPWRVQCYIHLWTALEKLRQLELLNLHKVNRVALDTASYNTVLDALRAHSRLAQALLAEMAVQQLAPNMVSFGAVGAAFAQGLQWIEGWLLCQALELMKHAQDASVALSTITCNSLITACERATQWSVCLELLGDLGAAASIVSFNAAISACARDQRSQRAWQLYQQLQAARLEPSMVTFNALIHAQSRASMLDLVHVLLRDLGQRKLQPDAVTHNAIIAGCASRHLWERALHYGESVPRKDVITYNGLITACEKGQQWEQALMFLARLHQAKFQGTVVSFSAAISACEQVQSWPAVIELLAGMDRQEMEANVITYSSAASAFEKASRWSEVLWLLSEMTKRELQPNVITYTSAMSGCEMSQRWEHSLLLFQDMQRLALAPGVLVRNVAALALEKGQRLPASRTKAQRLLMASTLRCGQMSARGEVVTRIVLQPMVKELLTLPSLTRGTRLGGGLHDVGLAWRENVCDLGPHFTRDAAEWLGTFDMTFASPTASQVWLRRASLALGPEPVAKESADHELYVLSQDKFQRNYKPLEGDVEDVDTHGSLKEGRPGCEVGEVNLVAVGGRGNGVSRGS